MKKDNAMAYGSIYLDDNENVEDLTKKQISSFVKESPVFVFFDIICKPEQIIVALAARGYVQQEMLAELEMDHHQVYVAIGFSDDERPARKAMVEYTKR